MDIDQVAYALKMRDVFQKISREIINKERPKYRYARVNSIDRASYKASVTYIGEESSVMVSMGSSVQPREPGQLVRVAGIGTDKFIEEVIGAPAALPFLVGSGLNVAAGGTDNSLGLNWGTGAFQVPQGNDARFSDARTPTPHGNTHTRNGSDPIPSSSGTITPASGVTISNAIVSGYGDHVIAHFSFTGVAIPAGSQSGISIGTISPIPRRVSTITAIGAGGTFMSGMAYSSTGEITIRYSTASISSSGTMFATVVFIAA